MKLYQWIAQQLARVRNLTDTDRPGGVDLAQASEAKEHILMRVHQYMPSGSGFDNGTTLDLTRSNANRLVFFTAFHHMDEHGGYDGWTDHEVWVSPDLCFDFTLRVTGRDRNQIKDLIHENFNHVLLTNVD